jgi:acylpyruvate hydrolase
MFGILFTCSFAGTPEGVGPVRVGQKIKAGITDLIDVEFDVQRRKRVFST